MKRLTPTRDPATSEALTRHARRAPQPRGSLARALLQEALGRREARDTRRTLARDYAAGRDDAKEILAELERDQLEVLNNDEA